MANVNPLLLVGAVIGVVTALLVFAYASVKDKKGSMGFERNMADGEIVRRLVQYAKPYGGKFIIVGFLVLFSISYDIASPLIVGYIEEMDGFDQLLQKYRNLLHSMLKLPQLHTHCNSRLRHLE